MHQADIPDFISELANKPIKSKKSRHIDREFDIQTYRKKLEVHQIVKLVEQEFALPEKELLSHHKSEILKDARMALAYLSRQNTFHNVTTLCKKFGISRTHFHVLYTNAEEIIKNSENYVFSKKRFLSAYTNLKKNVKILQELL